MPLDPWTPAVALLTNMRQEAELKAEYGGPKCATSKPLLKPFLKPSVKEHRAVFPCSLAMFGSTAGSILLTGSDQLRAKDFLAPYLLSSIDRGSGMVRMLNETPIQCSAQPWAEKTKKAFWCPTRKRRVDRYVTWGNHEADLSHEDVMCRVEEYQGATQLQLRHPAGHPKCVELFGMGSMALTSVARCGSTATCSRTSLLAASKVL